MQRVLQVLALAMFMSQLSSAADSAKDLEGMTQALSNKNAAFSESMKPLKAHLLEADKAIDAAKKEVKTAELWVRREDKNPLRKTKLKEAQEKLAAAEQSRKDLLSQEGDLSKSAAEVTKKAAAASTPAETKAQVPALATAMVSQNLLLEFSKLSNQLGGVDLALEKISTEYDRTLLGAYLKDKMGLLLNSQLICEAYNRCKVSGRKEIPADLIQKTLFPDTQDSTRSGNLYDKARSNSGAR